MRLCRGLRGRARFVSPPSESRGSNTSSSSSMAASDLAPRAWSLRRPDIEDVAEEGIAGAPRDERDGAETDEGRMDAALVFSNC